MRLVRHGALRTTLGRFVRDERGDDLAQNTFLSGFRKLEVPRRR
jgi:hypothetical protein